MKEKPILSSTDMVRAILEGRKTVTRRVLKPQPENELSMYSLNGAINWRDDNLNLDEYPYGNYSGCPYGQVGTILWVRVRDDCQDISMTRFVLSLASLVI